VAVGEEGTEGTVPRVEVTPVVTPLGGTQGGALPARAEPLAEGEVADPLPLVPPQVLEEPAGGKVQDQSDCKKLGLFKCHTITEPFTSTQCLALH
jgi:hypothetical protein